MKKKILIVLVVLVVAIGGVLVYLKLNKREENNTVKKDSKILVVYYSAQSHTKTVAESIAKNLDADIFELKAKNEYTTEDLNYGNKNSRVSKEHDDETLRNVELVTTEIPKWDSYDTILIGYPIWWGIAAWPVNNFVKNNDFTGKTVIPFCTSASSGLGQSGKNLEKMANSGTWLNGHRFSSNVSTETIKEWTDTLVK